MADAGARRAAAGAWRGTVSAMCAILVGTGLARFAYTPLIPALITAGWFAPADAAYLGAANLAGYLVGALLTGRIAARVPGVLVLRASMTVAAVSFLACAWPLSFLWFFVWRFGAGFAGASLMVLAAPSVLPHVAPSRRGLAGGVIMTGVGLGMALSGSLVPLLLRSGLVAAWCGLGALALALTLVGWTGWPDAATPPPRHRARAAPMPRVLKVLFVSYALNAVGLVPHMIFLVDYVARGLGEGLDAGARYWVLMGVGALAGPVVLGRLADRIGFAAAVTLAYAVQLVAVPLALVASGGALALSSVIIGAHVPGITALMIGRVRELVPPEMAPQQAAWSVATVAFAVGQAAGAYGLSYVFALSNSYALLFALGGVMIFLALACDRVAGR